jgi:hypothetical protein
MGIGWNILDGQGKDSENDNEMVATNGHLPCTKNIFISTFWEFNGRHFLQGLPSMYIDTIIFFGFG